MEKLIFADTFKNNLQSILRVPKVVIDDPIFRLHYRATGLALFFSSLVVSGYQFFGNPIMCIQRDDIPEQLLNTYCWIEGTFTLPKSLDKQVGEEVVYPGVEKYHEGDEVIEHAYYQWVCFVLFLQGLVFCAPYLLWHALEGGLVKTLIEKLKNPLLVKTQRDDRYKVLADYFHDRLDRHKYYAYKFFLCECLNFINVVGQMFFLNKFLGGLFTTYGHEVVKYVNEEQGNRTDPMIKIFPRITKCTFHKYGSSGDVQKHDALCLLPLNIINEKVFVVIWFWFVILAIMGGLVLVYRVSLMSSKYLRIELLNCVSSLSLKEDIEAVVNEISYGDFFLLYLLADNIDNLHFRNFLLEFKKKAIADAPAIPNIRDDAKSARDKKAIEAGEMEPLRSKTEVDV